MIFLYYMLYIIAAELILIVFLILFNICLTIIKVNKDVIKQLKDDKKHFPKEIESKYFHRFHLYLYCDNDYDNEKIYIKVRKELFNWREEWNYYVNSHLYNKTINHNDDMNLLIKWKDEEFVKLWNECYKSICTEDNEEKQCDILIKYKNNFDFYFN